MLNVEQTLSCDICGGLMNRLTTTVPFGGAMQQLGRGPIGVTNWHDVCVDCHIPLLNAITEAKKAAKDAK